MAAPLPIVEQLVALKQIPDMMTKRRLAVAVLETDAAVKTRKSELFSLLHACGQDRLALLAFLGSLFP